MYLFIFRDGGGAEGEGKRESQADSTQRGAGCGVQSHNPEITSAETKSHMLNQVSHAGVPI